MYLDLSLSPNSSTFRGPACQVIPIQVYIFVNSLGEFSSDFSFMTNSSFSLHLSTFWGLSRIPQIDKFIQIR